MRNRRKLPGFFYDSRVRCAHIDEFATEIVEIHCISSEFWSTLGITEKKISFSFGLEPPHAPIGIKLNRQVPCTNRSLSNLIQIGRHLGECRPNACCQLIIEDDRCLLGKSVNNTNTHTTRRALAIECIPPPSPLMSQNCYHKIHAG